MLSRVVIVGGGFGGVSAMRALRNTPVHVTLIDKRNYHVFRPMLYQAPGLLSADEISGPLRSIFSHQKNVDVLLDEVTGINSDQRIVHLARGDLMYDFLILATGIQYTYFGHDEWRQFAPGLESLDDADVIRGKILRAFERAEEMAAIEQTGIEEIRRQLTFAFVGAGTVGVEMASTLAEVSRMTLAQPDRGAAANEIGDVCCKRLPRRGYEVHACRATQHVLHRYDRFVRRANRPDRR